MIWGIGQLTTHLRGEDQLSTPDERKEVVAELPLAVDWERLEVDACGGVEYPERALLESLKRLRHPAPSLSNWLASDSWVVV